MPKRKRRAVSKDIRLRRAKKKADKALSNYAIWLSKRDFGGACPFCGKDPSVPVPRKDGKGFKKNRWVCFHFVRRVRKSVRWRLSNVVGGCSFCNLKERGNPDPYRLWYIEKRGVEAYLQLVRDSCLDFEPTEDWLLGVVETYEVALKNLLEADSEDAAKAASGGSRRGGQDEDGGLSKVGP